MSSSVSWNCEKCTYFHKCHGTRCAMCGTLRVTKQQMRDFITGKTLKRNEKDNATVSVQPNINLSQISVGSSNTLKSTKVSNPHKSENLVSSVTNPYVRPFSIHNSQSSALQQHPDTSSVQHCDKHQMGSATGSPSRPSTSSEGNSFNNGWKPPNPHLQGILHDRHHPVASLRPQTTQQPHGPAQYQNAPFVEAAAKARLPFQVGPVLMDPTVASEWIYPIHGEFPVRDYQLEISQTAILHNTLVSLPTGLGKTLIAAVILYNYYRWFPSGKVIFLAPTLPLVHQQIQACYKIMGIPASDTAVLTGRVSAEHRSLLWKERRVFFCTPQTVEKDMTAYRCDASLVVCIVFDEAHKASGNYAYTKVVELIEAAGAKFRILGLSATPGGEIKSIQKVVDALRISKIEARMEDDVSVKKYIHERHSEIIVVQQGSAITTVERLLTNVIAPVLEELRNRNGLTMIRGNATLTQYCLIKAKQEYNQRTGNHDLNYLFLAAQSLVGIRTAVRRVGIGFARQKLLNIRDDCRKGKMRNLANTPEFQAVMAHVLRSSSNPDDSQEKAEDRKLNNPKLMKLDEILKEHFERAKACGESSRAIVFSQWRDSVSEIVAVLSAGQPLLRPRHFVGQSKSVGKTDDKKSLNGMKQKEQQQVMMDFQNGLFNILVCTSIGEEGLDIGEVDLIVNFDTLRSPIRMIQRVGRTGRKRDGRVVCLISEGAEQKTMIASKQAEKTLGRALRRSDAFTFIPNKPMFPRDPELMKVDMSVTIKLQMSQVGGHQANGSGREKIEIMNKLVNEVDKEWRLTEEEENKRASILGPISSIVCESTHLSFPVSLRRQLLRGRDRSIVRYFPSQTLAKERAIGKSVTTNILFAIEHVYGKSIKKTMMMQASRLRYSRLGSSNARGMNNMFPIQKNEEKMDSIQQAWTQALEKPHNFIVKDEVRSELCSSDDIDSIIRLPTPEPSSDSESENTEEGMNNPRHVALHSMMEHDKVSMLHSPSQPLTVKLSQSRHPEQLLETEAVIISKPLRLPTPDPSSESDIDSDDNADDMHGRKSDVSPFFGGVLIDTNLCPLKQKNQLCPSPLIKSKHPPISLDYGVTNSNENKPSSAFRLPTQDSSSDEASFAINDDDDDESSSSNKASFNSPQVDIAIGSEGRWPDNLRAHKPGIEGSVDFSKCLDVWSDIEPANAVDLDTKQLCFPEIDKVKSTLIGKARVEKGIEIAEYVIATTGNPVGRPTVLVTLDTALVNTPFDNNFPGNENQESMIRSSRSLESNALTTQTTPRANTRLNSSHGSSSDLADTPLPVQSSGGPALPQSRSLCDLVDTPESKVDVDIDVVCSVCYSGEVANSDPIVLCDGPGNGESCETAVHVSCYSIKDSLDVDQWRCDKCDEKHKAKHNMRVKSIDAFCSLCQKTDGVLKLISTSKAEEKWFHPYCQTWCKSISSNSLCSICSWPGAICCHSESCTLSVHPHCGLFAKSKPWRVLVCQDEQLNFAFCHGHLTDMNETLHQMGLEAVNDSVKCLILPSSRHPKKSRLSDRKRGSEIDKPSKRRLRKKTRFSHDGQQRNEKYETPDIATLESTSARKSRIMQRLRQRHRDMLRSRYIDTEAAIDSDEDPDGDEDDDEIRNIEEEEFNSSFINDSSQLGYTQDELDRIDLDEEDDDTNIHRKLDAEDARMKQFATPILNRRMIKPQSSVESQNPWGETPTSDSQCGLGNMHFIRSVLEHHRNGGDADDIEALYHEIGRNVADEEEVADESKENFHKPCIEIYVPSDEDDSVDHQILSSQPRSSLHDIQLPQAPQFFDDVVSLTSEQKFLIEKKRQEAIKRRLEKSQRKVEF